MPFCSVQFSGNLQFSVFLYFPSALTGARCCRRQLRVCVFYFPAFQSHHSLSTFLRWAQSNNTSQNRAFNGPTALTNVTLSRFFPSPHFEEQKIVWRVVVHVRSGLSSSSLSPLQQIPAQQLRYVGRPQNRFRSGGDSARGKRVIVRSINPRLGFSVVACFALSFF